MKACSFLPAATRMIYDMDLQHLLQGVTFECPDDALNEKQIVVRCQIDGENASSADIDKIFSASRSNGTSLYFIDERKFTDINPDVIFTQDTCEVCQIDSKCTAAAVARLNKQPEIISLSPDYLEDVFATAVTIACALGEEEKASAYISSLKKRTGHISAIREKNGLSTVPVMLMEWMDPVYHCGHWIPEQIALAGGHDKLGTPGGYSAVVPWDDILNYDPAVIFIAPCGFTTERTCRELHVLKTKTGWSHLKAVRNHRVFLIDFDLFTQPSASTLVDGIELMAGLLHPEFFSVPPYLQHKYHHER
jgi:iron complex transport system substrate-binding protein